MIAQRYISSAEAQQWLKQHRKSTVATVNREALIAAAGAELEKDMQLVGVTAIEDKLQDEVLHVYDNACIICVCLWHFNKQTLMINFSFACPVACLLSRCRKSFRISRRPASSCGCSQVQHLFCT